MKKTCDICGGSGQISFFQGVSRFLLTVDECPHCEGTGLQLEQDSPLAQESNEGETKRSKKRKETQRDKKKS